jgi:uncharacterized protein YyaL (SSP411 family)
MSHLTADAGMAEKIERTFAAFAAGMSAGRVVPMMQAALSTHYLGIPQIIIAGDRDRTGMSALTAAVRSHYLPTAVVVPVDDSHRATLSRLLPWTEALRVRGGHATAYICRDFACETPATSVEDLEAQLRRLQQLEVPPQW